MAPPRKSNAPTRRSPRNVKAYYKHTQQPSVYLDRKNAVTVCNTMKPSTPKKGSTICMTTPSSSPKSSCTSASPERINRTTFDSRHRRKNDIVNGELCDTSTQTDAIDYTNDNYEMDNTQIPDHAGTCNEMISIAGTPVYHSILHTIRNNFLDFCLEHRNDKKHLYTTLSKIVKNHSKLFEELKKTVQTFKADLSGNSIKKSAHIGLALNATVMESFLTVYNKLDVNELGDRLLKEFWSAESCSSLKLLREFVGKISAPAREYDVDVMRRRIRIHVNEIIVTIDTLISAKDKSIFNNECNRLYEVTPCLMYVCILCCSLNHIFSSRLCNVKLNSVDV